MLPIDVDLSPLLINRTAIFTIGRDISWILTESGAFATRHRFFGRIASDWPGPETAQELLDLVGLAREAASSDRLRDWLPPANGGANGSSRVFLLDPLYVLFAPLSHDDIVMCLDLSTLTHPEWHDRVTGNLYQEAFRRILDVAPQLIMISQNTADTFYANFGAYRNRMTVVPLYLSELVEREAAKREVVPLRAASPYFLFVGSREARKNVIGAINAFAASGLAGEGYRLYLVGSEGHGTLQIERRAAEVPGIVMAGYLDDEELCTVYAGATGFLYPSYLEGFGVPLLEAMAFGIPSIATTAGASPEVGGRLVRYRDPDDYAGIAEDLRAIAHLAPAERLRIAAGLRERARREFSFARFSTRLLSAISGDDGAAP
jgi:glycosyltransferase involved in cell wall biosynthesis